MLALGQTTSIPVVSKVPTIILGMGALFGFPEQSDVSSIATIVSSRRWPLISSYGASGRKRKPDQIIIFRDGVSESQFNQVLIKLLRLASSLTRSGTLKIVQGPPDNMLHGTVIDKKVCHPKNNDFYLSTHAGMIGITRQTHYHLHSWGQFMKIRDASETSPSHGGMYAPRVIFVPQLSRLKDKVSNFILVY
ncbi:Protein argonaute 4 -like protein [Gossypium arboreum]|uniref:Protein argonaute 4-like protein n=2 Tax=Gossypium arboreum TaxID=29729 RepID=A0A0B0MAQ7_GOSAR|nr:Protein argonaute 4 -like protein [Gossypium arboreum]